MGLQQLFRQQLGFVRYAHEMLPFARLMNGFKLFTTTTLSFDVNGVTGMNTEQWEERLPTLEELSFVRPELFRVLKNQKYWIIKKSNRRTKRSLDYYRDDVSDSSDNKYPSRLTEVKHTWSEFVLDMIKIQMKARSHGQALVWSCNLTCLYDDCLKCTLLVRLPLN